MAVQNEILLVLASNSENVGVARVTAAAFAAQADDLTLGDIEEIKVAVSEAVSNAVIHGYGNGPGTIEFRLRLTGDELEFTISDRGKGIADIALARRPSYSSDPERMGLGFVFMESFMDRLDVESAVGKGTTVRMVKKTGPARSH